MGYGAGGAVNRQKYHAIYRMYGDFLEIAYGDVVPTEFKASSTQVWSATPQSAGRVTLVRLVRVRDTAADQ